MKRCKLHSSVTHSTLHSTFQPIDRAEEGVFEVNFLWLLTHFGTEDHKLANKIIYWNCYLFSCYFTPTSHIKIIKKLCDTYKFLRFNKAKYLIKNQNNRAISTCSQQKSPNKLSWKSNRHVQLNVCSLFSKSSAIATWKTGIGNEYENICFVVMPQTWRWIVATGFYCRENVTEALKEVKG